MKVPWRCGRRGAGQSRPGLECQRGFGDRCCAAHQDSVEPQRTKKTDLEVLLDQRGNCFERRRFWVGRWPEACCRAAVNDQSSAEESSADLRVFGKPPAGGLRHATGAARTSSNVRRLRGHGFQQRAGSATITIMSAGSGRWPVFGTT